METAAKARRAPNLVVYLINHTFHLIGAVSTVLGCASVSDVTAGAIRSFVRAAH